MSNKWIEKYRPDCIKDIIGNSNNILKFDFWLKNFKNEKNSSIVLSGHHGVGKTMITKIILDKNNFYFKWLNYQDEKGKNLFKDLENCFEGSNLNNLNITNKDRKFALVINDIEKISLKNEKMRIKDLVKKNFEKKIFPIIFISNMQHNKLLTDILSYSNYIKLVQPNDNDLKILLNRVIKSEDIKIKNNKIISKIVKFSQNDMRRLITILYDINSSFKEDYEIEYDDIKLYLKTSQKKCKDTSLFEATKTLIDNYSNIQKSLSLYKVDKVLVPLTIHENFYKSIFFKYNKNKILLEILKNITGSISKGDVIETNIYTDQNWFLHDIHGFYTCVMTSYHINKYKKTKGNDYYEMKFSSDLNQTSLKNINKKQISNLKKIFKDKSVDDILNLNKIVYNLVQNERIDDLFHIMKDYSNNIKTIETLIKIDKTLPKIVLSQKNKKKYNNLLKSHNLYHK